MKRTEEEIKGWYQLVLTGTSLQEIDKTFKTNSGYHFKNRNWVLPNKSEVLLKRTGRHKIIEFCEKIDSEEKAYILGLMYADGWTDGENRVGITLQDRDKDILLKIKDIICPDNTLKKEKNNWKLCFCSQKLALNLNKWGLKKNKTYIGSNIPPIEKNLIRHFIRGYFDGDGTIYLDRGYLRINICSITVEILKEFKQEFAASEIESIINMENRQNKTYRLPVGFTTNCKDMYRVFIRKNASLILLHKYLYEDATLFLERKKEKFDDWLYKNKKDDDN